MTAPNFSFYQRPDYQRQLAKLNRTERLVLGSLLLDTDAAEAEMKKQLTLMDLGQKQQATEKGLELKEKDVESDIELNRKSFETTTGLRERALEQEGRLSRERMATSSDITRSRIGSSYGIQKGRMDFEKKQLPWTAGIGIADVGAGALLGYGRMKLDTQRAKENVNLAKIYGGTKWL